MLNVRPATENDRKAIWFIIGPVIREGETYALPRDMPEAAALNYWTGPDRQTFVADEAGTVVGTYFIRTNQPGGGSHVANCGFMTHSDARKKGIARAMCEHSLDEARRLGFRAMQFSFVVSTNERAIRLWQSLRFTEVGRLPAAFQRPDGTCVDVLILFRKL